jgi:glycosyltransferase involved in cell wall biosynthesis
LRAPAMPSSVSVIIPAYNSGRRVTRTIETALNQTLPVREVIVVDDGSTDDTLEVVSQFGPRVRVVSKPNGGPASARNLGASLATGDWLAMLDADDWWFPRKNELQLAHSAADDIGLSHCRLDHRVERPPNELTFQELWDRNWISCSSVLIRHNVFDALGGFVEDPKLISVEDYNLWLRVAAAGWRVVACPHILVHYTQGIGISSDAERLMRASLYNVDELERRLGLDPQMAATKRKQIRAEFRRMALYDSDSGSARALMRHIFRDEPGVRVGLNIVAGTLFAPALHLKHRFGERTRPGNPGAVTLEDPRESEFAEHRIPVEEDPFWNAVPPPALATRQALPRPIQTEASRVPMLVTTVDAEEDFNWNGPFVRTASRVTSMRSQYKAHRVFERYGVIPTYLVD